MGLWIGLGLALVAVVGSALLVGLWYRRRHADAWYRVEVRADGFPAVPFFLAVEGETARVTNGESSLDLQIVERDPLQLRFPVFGTYLRFEGAAGRDSLTGRWQFPYPIQSITIDAPIHAERVQGPAPERRFPGDAPPAADISGNWKVDIDGFGTGRAVLRQDPQGNLSGALVPPEVGDTRHLSGRVIGDRFYLSTFDGIHAYLVTGEIASEGAVLRGTWVLAPVNAWSFSATRGQEPSVASLVSASLKPGFTRVSIPELEAANLSGKPVIVDLFGTWCPACLDLTPQLKALHERYADQGLVILSVAIEPAGDDAATALRLREFKERYGVDWDVKLRVVEDATTAFPPEIDRATGFPITLFIRRDGTVAHVHTAFISDAARPEHQEVIDSFDRWAREIVEPHAP